jgi:FkbH-like protein
MQSSRRELTCDIVTVLTVSLAQTMYRELIKAEMIVQIAPIVMKGYLNMLANSLKMVIWDLDDTFWKGTLAEGEEIIQINDNIEILKNLTSRGVVSSICSRNDFSQAETLLKSWGVWDYFIFPRIEFGPKGKNVAEIIESANLRPDNVLFIDDNPMNLQEALHFSPTLMTALPWDVLPNLLGHPQAKGKPDPKHIKLAQYKNIEQKFKDMSSSSKSNEEFLRECGIIVEIDHNIENNIERIIDMANKTNQLNFTKKRIEKAHQKDEFQALLGAYGVSGGVVSVRDRYGDYGIVGYYILTRLPSANRLEHFVFSCRIMNMGVEQYIYEMLGKPTIDIVNPVSNPISPFDKVDWINVSGNEAKAASGVPSNKKLVLVGSCQLLQLSAFCSSSRHDFVNEMRRGMLVSFDDAGFILSDPKSMEGDRMMKNATGRTLEDRQRFDEALSEAELVIVAPANMITGTYFKSKSGNMFNIRNVVIQRLVQKAPRKFFEDYTFVQMDREQRLDTMRQAMTAIAKRTPRTCLNFALGSASGEKLPSAVSSEAFNSRLQEYIAPTEQSVRRRKNINNIIMQYCDASKLFTFIDVDNIIPENEQYDVDHYTRRGYLLIADAINKIVRDGSGK